jgi:archaellum component FlaC
MELRECFREFLVNLINQLNTSFDAKIGKINEELEKCNKNYQDMRLELETITKGSRSPRNSTSQSRPH